MMMFYGWSAAWSQVHHQASVSRITNHGKTGVLGLGIIASARYAKLRGVPARFAGGGAAPQARGRPSASSAVRRDPWAQNLHLIRSRHSTTPALSVRRRATTGRRAACSPRGGLHHTGGRSLERQAGFDRHSPNEAETHLTGPDGDLTSV
jgi:hypothetical protein